MINIGGLAIGIAVCITLFIVIQFESSFDNFHKNTDRIYRVLTEFNHDDAPESFYGMGVPYPLPQELKRSFPEFEKVATVYSESDNQFLVLDESGSVERKFKEKTGIFYADPELFDILDYEWIFGDASSLEELNNVVLTKETAEKYFDTWQNSIGKFIKRNDSELLKVTGILSSIPKNTDLQFKAVISFGTGMTLDYTNSDNWDGTNGGYGCFVLLSPNASVSHANTHLRSLAKEKKSKESKNSHVLQSIDKIHYDTKTENYSNKKISHNLINILWMIGAFILLIACVNFVNLSTAQAVNRSREIGVRKVLGSNQALLKIQFLAETFLIVIFSEILALFIVFGTLPFVGELLGLPLSIGSVFNSSVLILLTCGTIVITFFAGFYPSLVLSKFNPVITLKGKAMSSLNKGLTLRRSLVIFQFSIAQVLIIGTLIMVKQMDYFSNQSLGYNKEAIINMAIPTDSLSLSKIDLLNNRLSAINGIQNVRFSSNTPTENRGTNSWTRFVFDNDPENIKFYCINKSINHEFVNTYGLDLIAGRNIRDTHQYNEFLINETLMKNLGYDNPAEILNKKINLWDGYATGEIVGVLKDFHVRSFKDGISPVFMTNIKDMFTLASVKLATEDISSSINSIEDLWNETFPNYVFEYQFLDDKVASYYEQEQRLSHLYKLFAGISIFLSCLGLYGLVSFLVTQKMKEVGIRKVLGSSVANIIYLFSKEFIILVAIGFFIASPIAWYAMDQWLQEYVFRIELNAFIFIIGGISAILIALTTIGFQAVKAALANPVESLRSE